MGRGPSKCPVSPLQPPLLRRQLGQEENGDENGICDALSRKPVPLPLELVLGTKREDLTLKHVLLLLESRITASHKWTDRQDWTVSAVS